MPAAGKGPAAVESTGGRTDDYGKQSAEEARDAASRGAQDPVEKKKGDSLGGIEDGAKEGIKKSFQW